MDLKVTTDYPAGEELEVVVYGRLTARSQFQAALGGAVSGPFYDATVALSKLANDPRGGLDVNIPVNQPTGASAYDALPIATTGVYPVQAFLEKAGVRKGEPLTTFIVYAGNDARNLQRLDVALIAPFAAMVPISPAGSIGPCPQRQRRSSKRTPPLWHARRSRSPSGLTSRYSRLWPRAREGNAPPSPTSARLSPRATSCSRALTCPSM